MPQITPQETFYRYVPEKAAELCIKLWYENKFDLKITPGRATKLGDYKYDYLTKKHTISVNHDLNKYGFLITYLHEVAHLKAFTKFGNKVQPHGKEWKSEFQKLMTPILTSEVFPPIVLKALKKYMLNPKASSCSDHDLYEAIRTFDTKKGQTTLTELLPGERFIFNKRLFIKEELRRTRYLCKEEKTGKKYLIPKVALVHKVPSEASI